MMTIEQTSSEEYFPDMSYALARDGAFQPTLVVDKQRLDHNIEQLLAIIEQGFDYRIVAKSLPSLPLLKYIMERTGSCRLMSFHLPFLTHIVEHIPNADILLGKPMPVESVRQFYLWYARHPELKFDPMQHLQWLVDSTERLGQYQLLADELQIELNINLEIDIGLHRGGFDCDDLFISALSLLKHSPSMHLSGLMGYEPHVSKIPALLGGREKAFTQAMASYQHYKTLISNTLGIDVMQGLTFNAGGSSTYPLYKQPGLVNEIATASALVKPTDFDVETLEHHQPAAFIATPVLKTVHDPELPMAKGLSKLLRQLKLLPRKACFIYGGNWLAKPCYPAQAKCSSMFGHSSNQEMYDLPQECSLQVDDFMFFRPSQSEAVFLQFGEVAVYELGKIVDWWSVFQPTKLTS